MKTINKILAAGLIAGIGLAAMPMVASADPQMTFQTERAAHPRLSDAIRKMHEALKELEAAPDDFGGHKAVAMADTRRAIHSLKAALYYRLKMDDAAIDKAE